MKIFARVFLVTLLSAIDALPLHAMTLECERYTVQDNLKANRTIFVLEFDRDISGVRYRKVSGPEWFLPSGSVFKPVWVSTDHLRVVATWLASDYGRNEERWSPVYVLDIDFGRPGFRDATYGGFADFSEIISSPWKQECKRSD